MKKILSLFAAVVLLASAAYAKEKVTLLMDWFPQGNQSGFRQARGTLGFSTSLNRQLAALSSIFTISIIER